jgi:peptidyl-prolyl cis-trans isomerase D
MQQQLVQRISAKADGYVQRLKKGESLAALAASAGAKVQQANGVTRGSAKQFEALGRDFLGRLFQAKAGDVFSAADVNYSIAVVKVTQIQPGDINQIARDAVALQPQLTVQMAQSDVPELVFAAAREEIKTKVDEARARLAIGLQPETPSSSGPGKAPSKAQ